MVSKIELVTGQNSRIKQFRGRVARANYRAGQNYIKTTRKKHTHTHSNMDTTSWTNVRTGFTVQQEPSDFNAVHDKSYTVAAAVARVVIIKSPNESNNHCWQTAAAAAAVKMIQPWIPHDDGWHDRVKSTGSVLITPSREKKSKLARRRNSNNAIN